MAFVPVREINVSPTRENITFAAMIYPFFQATAAQITINADAVLMQKRAAFPYIPATCAQWG